MGWSPGTESRTLLSQRPPTRALPPGPQQPPTVARDAAVLLAFLLRVELVAVALAAPVGKGDALSLDSIKCPELDEASAGATDYGEVAGRCGVGSGHTALAVLTIG